MTPDASCKSLLFPHIVACIHPWFQHNMGVLWLFCNLVVTLGKYMFNLSTPLGVLCDVFLFIFIIFIGNTHNS